MKIDITNQSGGVKAVLKGFNSEELTAKIEACKRGECSCDCDPTIMQKIDGIELTSIEDGSVLTVTGNVDADTLAPMMQECLIGEKQ